MYMKRMVPEPIHVVLTFDDSFWAPAYALMRSICLSTHRRSDLVFHLCYNRLSDKHRADLDRIAEEFGALLCFYDLSSTERFKQLVGRVPHHKRLTDIVYARFVIDRFLPGDVDRVIYLDCDMMVMAPIENLWASDLKGKPLAAVEDPWGKLIGSGRDINAYERILDPADPYFNAGLMVIDLSAWREQRVAERLEKLIENGTVAQLSYSQNVLNLLMKNNWERLDSLWNVVDPEPAHVALNPYNLHFTGSRRPWQLLSRVGYARMYRHVMTNELFYRYMWFRAKTRLLRFFPFLKVH